MTIELSCLGNICLQPLRALPKASKMAQTTAISFGTQSPTQLPTRPSHTMR